jgi:hypothetical protein
MISKILFVSLLGMAVSDNYTDITQEEFNVLAVGKWTFLDMYAGW